LGASSDALRFRRPPDLGLSVCLIWVCLRRHRDPQISDEEEYLENLFDVLCSTLMLPDNKAAFLKSEGAFPVVVLLLSEGAFPE
jgi:beta-catenin-like protein 1